MKFAKIFERGDDQVLVRLDNSSGGFPQVSVIFEINGGFVSLNPTFEGPDDAANERAARKAFDGMTDTDAVFALVDKTKADILGAKP